MAIQAGFNGSVAMTTIFGNMSMHSTAFTVNFRSDVNMYETFASRFKSKQLGTQDVTGSVSGICNDGAAFVGGSHGDFTVEDFRITYGSGRTITCDAVCTNVSLNKASVGGSLEMSFDFESDGDVVIA